MLTLVLTTLVTALSLLVVDLVVPGVGITTFSAAVGAAISIGLVNSFIKPGVRLLSLPINLLSLGAFSFVINGFCFWLASLVVPGFTVHGLFAFLFGPIVLSFVSTLLADYCVRKGIDRKFMQAGRWVDQKLGELQPTSESTPKVVVVKHRVIEESV